MSSIFLLANVRTWLGYSDIATEL